VFFVYFVEKMIFPGLTIKRPASSCRRNGLPGSRYGVNRHFSWRYEKMPSKSMRRILL